MTPTEAGTDPAPHRLVTRRLALRAVACSTLVVVAGCSTDRIRGDAAGSATPAATKGALDSDLGLVTAAISAEEMFAAFCEAAGRRFRDQRPLLLGLVERQRLHVARLRAALTNLAPPVNHRSPPLPGRASDLLLAVGDLALEARIARSASCLTATSGLLAQLFASVAASHAVTVQLTEPRAADTPVSAPDAVSSATPLQPCLAAEHAAVYGYSLLGGVLSAAVSNAPTAEAATASYDAHRERRDLLTQLITTAGGRPVAAEPAYDVPFRVSTVATARRLARDLEAGCAAIYARATAVTTADTRLMMSSTLLDCAVRGSRWGDAPVAFPGLGRT